MKSKTKYFILAILFGIVALTVAGYASWNIHLQTDIVLNILPTEGSSSDGSSYADQRLDLFEKYIKWCGTSLSSDYTADTVLEASSSQDYSIKVDTELTPTGAATTFAELKIGFNYEYYVKATGEKLTEKPTAAGEYFCKIIAVSTAPDSFTANQTAIENLNKQNSGCAAIVNYKINSLTIIPLPTVNPTKFTYNDKNQYTDILGKFTFDNNILSNATLDTNKVSLTVCDKDGNEVSKDGETPICTDAGSYTFKFTIKNTAQYKWNTPTNLPVGTTLEGSTASVTIEISKLAITFTAEWGCYENGTEVAFAANNTVTYTGNTFTVKLKNVDTKLQVTYTNSEGIETNKGTNAGDYTSTATVSVKADYATSCEITGDASYTINWKIDRAPIAKPALKEGLTFTYTGSDQLTTIKETAFNNYNPTTDTNKIDLSAPQRVINAYNGATPISYPFRFTPSDNYKWESGNATETVEIVITLNKANLTATSLTIVAKDPRATGLIEHGDELKLSTCTVTGVNNTTIQAANYTVTIDDAVYSGSTETVTQTVNCKFTPTGSYSNNYNELVVTCDITVSAVAKIDSTYYGTIESALNAAASGKTVYVLVGKNPIIRQNCTIASGVILCLPYADDGTWSSRAGTAGTFADADNASVNKNLKNNVVLNNNVTLTVNGTLQIGGILGHTAQGLSGQTSGTYCQILMKEGSKITSTGKIDCYGYIKTYDKTTNATVEATAGTIYAPFVVYDFRGGSSTVGAYAGSGSIITAGSRTPNISPFSVYDMPNIHSTVKVNSTAELWGYADLYAGNQHNTTEIKIIASSGSVLNLSNGSYVLSKYTPGSWDATRGGYTSTNTNTGRTTLNIYGGASLGSMQLTVSVSIVTATVSTDKVLFPVSWKYDVILNSGTYTLGYDIKFLTGSSLMVETGATLNINSKCIFYREFKDVDYGGSVYPTKDAAELTVNGTVNINDGASFGGNIATEKEGAKLVVSSGATRKVSSKEGYGTSSSLNVTYHQTNLITEVLRLYQYTGSSVSETARSSTAGTYNSKQASDLKCGWYAESATISYNLNGGTYNGVSTIASNTVDTRNNGYTLTESDIPTGTFAKQYYSTGNWYFDVTDTEPVKPGDKIYLNVELIYKWTPVEYSFTFEHVYHTDVVNPPTETSVTITPTTFNVETFTMPDDPVNGEYVFGGWYLTKNDDGVLSDRIYEFDGNVLVQRLVDGKTKVYCYWYPIGTETYTINYNNNDMDYIAIHPEFFTTASQTMVSVDTTFTLPDLSGGNGKEGYAKYFDGWYGDAGFTNKANNADLINWIKANANADKEITLYAHWINQYKITFTANEYLDKDGNKLLDTFNASAIIHEGATYKLNELVNYDTSSVDYNVAEQKYFYGWTDGSTEYSRDNEYTPSGVEYEIKLTADWKDKLKLTINLKANGSLRSSNYTINIVNGNGTYTYTDQHEQTGAFIADASTNYYYYLLKSQKFKFTAIKANTTKAADKAVNVVGGQTTTAIATNTEYTLSQNTTITFYQS